MGFPVKDVAPQVLQDLVDLLCGDLIAEGLSRRVYEHQFDKNKVVKIEYNDGYFQNVREAQTWSDFSHSPHRKWLAPVHEISRSGLVLIMERTEQIPIKFYPKKLPEWIPDTKKNNFGYLNGKVVCHDYGTNLLLNHGAFKAKMQKVNWKGIS